MMSHKKHATSVSTIVAIGSYDTTKPRIRILIRGLREKGIRVPEYNIKLWNKIPDKSLLKKTDIFKIATKYLFSIPKILWNYAKSPSHEAVLLGYPGIFDLFIIWPLAKIKGALIILDNFIPVYNTIVEDRRLLRESNPLSKFVWALEWAAIHMSDLTITDTKTHADYLRKTFNAPAHRIAHVYVGAEPDRFCPPKKSPQLKKTDKILFYGQFIPLHGIDTIIEAAKVTENDGIKWTIIGTGQEEEKIRRLVDQIQPKNIEWIRWVPYEKLMLHINDSCAILGIFGNTSKASRVIPNKIFQALAAEKPIITRDSPAIREILKDDECHILVRPADPSQLAEAAKRMLNSECCKSNMENLRKYVHLTTPIYCATQLIEAISRARKYK